MAVRSFLGTRQSGSVSKIVPLLDVVDVVDVVERVPRRSVLDETVKMVWYVQPTLCRLAAGALSSEAFRSIEAVRG